MVDIDNMLKQTETKKKIMVIKKNQRATKMTEKEQKKLDILRPAITVEGSGRHPFLTQGLLYMYSNVFLLLLSQAGNHGRISQHQRGSHERLVIPTVGPAFDSTAC